MDIAFEGLQKKEKKAKRRGGDREGNYGSKNQTKRRGGGGGLRRQVRSQQLWGRSIIKIWAQDAGKKMEKRGLGRRI